MSLAPLLVLLALPPVRVAPGDADSFRLESRGRSIDFTGLSDPPEGRWQTDCDGEHFSLFESRTEAGPAWRETNVRVEGETLEICCAMPGRSVSFTCDAQGVRLQVSSYGGEGDEAAGPNLDLSGDDWRLFKEIYRPELAEHLRPILADLGQLRILDRDPFVAAQLDTSLIHPTPAALAAVKSALWDWLSPDWRIRDLGNVLIAGGGDETALALLARDGPLTPEQSLRRDAALSLLHVLSRDEIEALEDYDDDARRN